MHLQTSRTIALLGLTLLAAFQTASAETVGHWRFEDTSPLGKDSSGKDLTLQIPASSSVYPVKTPFPSEVPGTDEPNRSAAYLEKSNRAYLYLDDNEALDFQSFTFEAYLQLDELAGGNPNVIGAQWDIGPANGAGMNWQLEVSPAGNLSLRLGNALSGGTGRINTLDSGFKLELGKQYYVAVSVEATQIPTAGSEVIFYVKNLTDGTPLESSSQNPQGVYVLNDLATAPFSIGANYNNGKAYEYRTFSGIIDEVRLSNTVIVPEE